MRYLAANLPTTTASIVPKINTVSISGLNVAGQSFVTMKEILQFLPDL